jgi:Protein of unknown function (DUF2523)
MNLVTLLLGLAGPLAMRVLATIGFSALTITGVDLVVTQLITAAQGYWSNVPAAMLQMGTLAGLPEAAGLICGAFLARVAMWQIAQATRMLFTGRA